MSWVDLFRRTRPFILVCLILPSIPYAQMQKIGERWRWVQFTTEVGLPSNRVFDIVETRSGTIWAITQMGLAWFDEYYWHPVGFKEGLPEGRASAIAECPNNEILVLSAGRLFRGGTHGFSEIFVSCRGRGMCVTGIATLPDTRILAVSDSALYELKSDSLQACPGPGTDVRQRILSVVTTKDGSTWVNATLGLYRMCGGTWSLALPAPGSPLAVWDLVADRRGRGLAYINSPLEMRGVWELSPGISPLRVFDQFAGLVNSVDADSSGDALAVFETGRIVLRRGGVWEDIDGRPNLMKDVLFIHFRPNGDFWMGTESALYLFLGSSSRWTYWADAKSPERMSVNEIIEARDGTVWVGSTGGLELHRKEGRTEVIERINGERVSSVTGIAQDRDGNIWISSGGGFEGAYRWDGTRWTHLGAKEGLDARFIHRIALDRRGRPWFLGLAGYENPSNDDVHGPGAFVYDQGHFTRWGQQEGLPSGRVYSFDEGDNGEYWFGTSSGLGRWNGKQWTYWSVKNGLKNDRVFTLAVDHQNRLWFGDQNNGIGVISNDSLKYYTTSDGLVSDAVWEVKVDARGRLWIATRGGLGSYDKGEWCAFGPGSGLSHTRLWPLLTTGTKVYVGTSGGGTAILNLQDEALHASHGVFAEPVIEAGSVFLRWEAYSYFGEIGHRDVETRYRLDGQPFSAWGRGRELTLLNVPPGHHTFHVQARGLFGIRDSAGQAISFDMPQPLYRQPVFFLPIAALSAGLVGLVIVQVRRKRRFDRLLRQRESLYRSVVEDQAEFIMRFLPDGVRTFVNGAYCRHFGLSEQELIGTNFFSSLSEENKLRVRRKLALLTPESPVATDEHPSAGPHGGIRWHQWTDRAVFDEKGHVIEFQAVGREITRLKDAEQALRASEARYRLISENAGDVIWTLDVATQRFTFVSPSVERLRGYTPEEVLTQSMKDVLTPESFDRVSRGLPDRLTRFTAGDASARVQTDEVDQPRKDGSIVPTEVVTTLLTNEQGDVTEVLGVSRDITERKRNAEALRASEERFRKYFELGLVGMAITSPTRGILEVNDQICQILGYDRNELLRKTWHGMTYPEDVSKDLMQFNRVLAGEIDGYSLDKRWIRKDGRVIDSTVSLRCTRRPDGSVDYFVALLQDITERKQAEDENRMLRHSIDVHFDGAYWFDTNNRAVYINDAGCKALGYDRDELIGKSLSDINPRATPELLKGVWDRLRTDGHYTAESVHYRRDGSAFPVEIVTTYVQFGGKEYSCGFARDITERKRVEEALRASEKRYRQLIENIHEAMIIDDVTGTVIFANEQFLGLYGFAPEQGPHLSLEDYVAPEWRDVLRDRHNRRVRGEEVPDHFEYEGIHQSGKRLWLDVHVVPMVDDAGRVIGTQSLIRDITERKHAEEELRKWAHIFEHAQWGVAASAADEQTFALMNSEFAHMHGYEMDELLDTPIIEVYPPECRADFREHVRRAHDTGHHTFESQHLRKDGTVFPVLVDMTVVKDDSGKVLYRVVSIQDITERKRTEEALRLSSERQALLLRSIPMAFYTAATTENMVATWVSDGVERMTGFPPARFLGDSSFWERQLHPDDQDCAVKEVESILTRGSISSEYRWLCQDGTYHWFLDLAVLIRNEEGSPGEVIGAWLDITDRKKTEQELRDSRSRMTKLNQCLLSFGPDPDENINRLVALCGEQLEGTAALYNRLEGENLFSVGQWHVPVGYSPLDEARGHICFDVIHKKENDAYVVRNLGGTPYASSDPNVKRFGLETYVGQGVSLGATRAGSLCVVYDHDCTPSDEDLELLGIAASAIGVEEKRKRAEEQLRRSEQQYRQLFMEYPHPMYVHDMETLAILAVNDAAVTHYGYSRSEFLAKTIMDIRPEEDIPALRKEVQKTAGSQMYSGVWRHQKKDGSIIFVDIGAHGTRFEGRPARIILAMDVTARRQAEERVAMLGHTLRSISEAVTITDLNNRILFVNNAFLSMYGYTETEVIGKSIDMVRAPHDPMPTVSTILEATERTGWHGELINRRKDGSVFPVSLSTSVVHDDTGRAIGLVGITQDITERRQAEEALQKSEQQFRTLFESMAEGVALHELVCDDAGRPVDYRILDVNPSYVQQTGISENQAKGMLASALYGTGGSPHLDVYVRVAQSGESHSFETYFPPLQRHFRIGVSSPGKNFFATICEDITDRKVAEEQIRASLREKEVLLKEIHHRVKNNLQVISSLLSLQSQYVKDQGSLALFKESQNRVKSMAMIHEKLYQSEDLANVDFGSYVKNLTAYLFRSYAINPDLVSLSVDIQETRLNIDKAIPCGLIINELVTNSLKYAFPNGGRGEIIVRLIANGESSVVLTVCDNGVGLPESFDIETADSLGLQLVSSLAEQLGAVVDVRNNAGAEYRLAFTL